MNKQTWWHDHHPPPMRTQSNLPQDSILGNRNEVHWPQHHKQHKGSVHSCVFWLTLKTFPLLVCHLHIQWLSVDEDRISWRTFPRKRFDILWRTRNTSPYVLMMITMSSPVPPPQTQSPPGAGRWHHKNHHHHHPPLLRWLWWSWPTVQGLTGRTHRSEDKCYYNFISL